MEGEQGVGGDSETAGEGNKSRGAAGSGPPPAASAEAGTVAAVGVATEPRWGEGQVARVARGARVDPLAGGLRMHSDRTLRKGDPR